MEIWKNINGLNDGYMISSHGRVKRTHISILAKSGKIYNKKERLLKVSVGHNGYSKITIKNKNFRISRLVADNFIPNLENKPQVNHINGVKSDNRVENLEWCTLSENMTHAFKNGLCKSGAEHYNARIVLNTQSGIFHLSAKEAALTYGIVYGSLVNMLNGRRHSKTFLEYV